MDVTPARSSPGGHRLTYGMRAEHHAGIVHENAQREMPVAKPNYQFDKRQRDLAKKKKQDEKRQRKQAKTGDATDTAPSSPDDTPAN
jgi:hypothetical protein